MHSINFKKIIGIANHFCLNYFQSFKLLNEIALELDAIISNFDVYKVEYINNKYMVASGIPKENGRQSIDQGSGKDIFKHYSIQSISTSYLISLNLISKATHENIGFEKLQFLFCFG